MTKKRQYRSPEQKAAILKRHHVDKVPVTTACEEADQLQPSVFYAWQRDLFERAHLVLGTEKPGRTSNREQELERENAALKAKLAKKDQVIAEISQEYVDLKKELGEP